MRIGNLDVPGYDLLVTANLHIKSDDLGGNTSGTDSAHLGYEPKTLEISLKIKYIDEGDLTRLSQLAEQLDAAKKPKVFNIVDRTAKAMNIRQVRFSENFRVREDEMLHQWQVTFELKEYRSVAEKIEQRQTVKPAVVQQADEAKKEEPLTNFEKFLQSIDQVLAPK